MQNEGSQPLAKSAPVEHFDQIVRTVDLIQSSTTTSIFSSPVEKRKVGQGAYVEPTSGTSGSKL